MVMASGQPRTGVREAYAAVARKPGGQFTIEAVHLDAPRPGEVIVKIAGAGICHTDLVFRDQFVPFSLPAVLGHEGAGVVVETGAGVTDVRPGDRVVISYSSCGECDRCRERYTSYCRSFAPLNYGGRRLEDGSTALSAAGERLSSHFFGQSCFASHAVARSRNLIKIDDTSLPLEILGPLACGIQTGAGSVLNALACQPGSSIAILGGGSVGLSAVMAAALAGCAVIAVVEPFGVRRALALDLGATHVLDSASGDVAGNLRAISAAGFDFVLDSTGNSTVIEAGLAALGNRGTMGLLGLPGRRSDGFKANIASLIASGGRITGITEGDSDPREFIPKLISHYKAGRFPFPKLITTFNFADINRAVELRSNGDVVKAVLLP